MTGGTNERLSTTLYDALGNPENVTEAKMKNACSPFFPEPSDLLPLAEPAGVVVSLEQG